MATTYYYVSSEATNGYAVGNDANDGLSKEAPFLTLDPFEGAGFSWTDEDHIYLNGARVNCSAGLTLDGTVTIEGDVDKTEIYLRSVTASNYGIIPTAGKTHTFTNCVINEGGCTTAPIYISTTASLCTLVFTNVEIIYPAWGIYSASTDLLCSLTMTNCKFTSSYTAGAGNAAIYMISLGTASEVAIDGLELDIDHDTITSVRGGILLGANVADLSVSIKNVTGHMSRADGTSVFYAIWLTDFAVNLVEDCNFSMTGTGAAHGIRVTSATQTVTSAAIRDCRVRITCPNGIGICGGLDGVANVADNGEISGCVVDGRGATADALHGIEVGGNEGWKLFNNAVHGCVYGFVTKETTASYLSHNIVTDVPTAGIAYYMKGGDAAVLSANGHIVSGAENGTTINVGPNAANNSTGVILAGNWRYEHAGSTTATYIIVVAADQEAIMYGNNWYSKGTFANTAWYHVDGAKTWAQWNALANVHGDSQFQFRPPATGTLTVVLTLIERLLIALGQ